MDTSKVLESISLIRFPDCDPFNHLNNACYLDYFVNAREDQIEEKYQVNAYHLAAEKGVSWLVTKHQILYIRPANLMEKVVIQSVLTGWHESRIEVEMRMWNLEKTQLKSLLWTTLTHFNLKTQRRELHSEEMNAKFSSETIPLPPNITLEQRAKQLQLEAIRQKT